MKRIVYIAAILILSAFGASAQSPTTTYPYLYDHFKDGVIIMSDGSQKAKQMNVHLRAGRLHYIDNGVIKEAFLADVSAVEIGKDVFLPVYSTLMLVVAKNEEAQLNLAKQFFVHSIERRYVAIV